MRSRRHIPALDGIRGCAILMVMLLHFTTVIVLPTGSVASGLRAVLQWGWAGVDLFFVLSGFLITGILLDGKGGPHYFRTFYARRVLRIFPLYYATLAVYFLAAPHVVGPSHHVPFQMQARYWAFLGNYQLLPWESWSVIGHFWSLGIEEQFYLAWPLIVFACGRRETIGICLAAVVGAFAFRFAELSAGASGWLVYHYTPGRIDGLALGALIALLVRDPLSASRLRRWSPYAALVAVGVLTMLAIRSRGLTNDAANFQMMSVGYSAIALLFAAAVARVVTGDPTGRVAQVLSARPLVTLGTFSYAIYVFHPALLRLVGKARLVPAQAQLATHPLIWILAFPLAMVMLSVACGYASWHLFEKHFIALKRHFAYRTMPGSMERASGPAQ